MRIDIDVNSLTLGEIDFFEEASGLSFDELSGGKVTTKALMALIVIQERRKNPEYSMADAAGISIAELDVSALEGPQSPKRRAKAAS